MWDKELPRELWAYRNTVRTLMGETPYAKTCGSVVVILVEIGVSSHITQYYSE